MAKIRTIKPSFFSSGQVASCSVNARILFIGIWVFSDDAGIHPASSRTLRLEVLPGDHITDDQVNSCIEELIQNELLFEYSVDGKKYWKVTGWEAHQKIARRYYKHPPPLNHISSCLSENTKATKLDFKHDISTADTLNSPCLSSDQAMFEQCSSIPGNGNGNGNDNGKEICRVASASRPVSSNKQLLVSSDNESIAEIFSFWKSVMNHPKAQLDEKRRRKIKSALQQYSFSEIQQAIKGCSLSSYHKGNNDSNTVYDSLELILRDAEHIERFIRLADSSNQTDTLSINHSNAPIDNIFAGAI